MTSKLSADPLFTHYELTYLILAVQKIKKIKKIIGIRIRMMNVIDYGDYYYYHHLS